MRTCLLMLIAGLLLVAGCTTTPTQEKPKVYCPACGSLLIGLLMGGDLHHPLLSGNLRVGLAVGFLGGFTTFSTFSYETVRLLESGSIGAAFFNVLFNVVLCLLAAWVGIVIARQL